MSEVRKHEARKCEVLANAYDADVLIHYSRQDVTGHRTSSAEGYSISRDVEQDVTFPQFNRTERFSIGIRDERKSFGGEPAVKDILASDECVVGARRPVPGFAAPGSCPRTDLRCHVPKARQLPPVRDGTQGRHLGITHGAFASSGLKSSALSTRLIATSRRADSANCSSRTLRNPRIFCSNGSSLSSMSAAPT